MIPPNYITLRLRALASASAASLLALLQRKAGNTAFASKIRDHADRRRNEAEFFSSLRFIP